MKQKKISIAEVLDAIKETLDFNLETKVFAIRAIYTDGPRMGKFYTKNKVRRHSTTSYRNQTNKAPKRSVYKTNKEEGLIMLYDLIEHRPFTVPYWALKGFNGQEIDFEYGK